MSPTTFTPALDPAAVADLRARLTAARLPEPAPGPDDGLGLDVLTRLLERWRDGYDLDALAARWASVPQVRVPVDGLEHHAIHLRSDSPDAVPLLLGHGWPSTCFEFLPLLGLLGDFHVVAPSLPGYGFSGHPAEPGWDADRTADAWAGLMGALGHEEFLVHGGDWGAIVGTSLAVRHPDRVRGLHLTMPRARWTADDLGSDFERAGAERVEAFRRTGYGYAQIQRTRPQTIGYALLDSPVGLLAWIAEKLLAWSTPGRFPDDTVLDVVSTYWFTATGASAARLYLEALHGSLDEPVTVPTGCSIFADEVVRTPRAAVERRHTDVRSWTEHPVGGHFPAVEVPDVLAAEIRAFAGRC